jgi:hypothetical protein
MSEDQYNQLKPHINKIKGELSGAGSLSHDYVLYDRIAQELGRGSTCFNCSGDLLALIQFLNDRIDEYGK